MTAISRESQDMTSEDNIVTALLNKEEIKQYSDDGLKELDESEKQTNLIITFYKNKKMQFVLLK